MPVAEAGEVGADGVGGAVVEEEALGEQQQVVEHVEDRPCRPRAPSESRHGPDGSRAAALKGRRRRRRQQQQQQQDEAAV